MQVEGHWRWLKKYSITYLHICEKFCTFAATRFDEIHNKDYSEGVNIQSGTQVPLFFYPYFIEIAECWGVGKPTLLRRWG